MKSLLRDLQVQVIIAIIMVTVLPMSILGGLLYYFSSQQAKEIVAKNVKTQVHLSEQEIRHEFNLWRGLAEMSADQAAILAHFDKKTHLNEAFANQEKTAEIFDAYSFHPNLVGFGVISLKNETLTWVGPPYSKKWLEGTSLPSKKNKMKWYAVKPSSSQQQKSQKHYLGLYPVNNANNAIVGYVCILFSSPHIDLSKLESVSRIIRFDERGTLASDSHPMQQTPNLTELKSIKKTQTEKKDQIIKINGENYLVHHYDSPVEGWKTYCLTPMYTFEALHYKTIAITFFALAIGILVSGLISWYFFAQFIPPIRSISTTFKQLTQENGEKKEVPQLALHQIKNNEMESLVLGVNKLIDVRSSHLKNKKKLEQAHAEIIELNKSLESKVIDRTRALNKAYLKMKLDLEAAAKIQKSLLPEHLPAINQSRFNYLWKPCDDLGGDVLNVFPLDDRYIAVYLIDVSGHGVQAALLAATLSHLLSTQGDEDCILKKKTTSGNRIATPTEVAMELNKKFPINPETFQYFTLHYGILDTKTNTYDFVSAGHPNPILTEAGKKPVIVKSKGPGIGINPKPNFQPANIKLPTGCKLYLLSDGILEANNEKGIEYFDGAMLNHIEKMHSIELESNPSALRASVEHWRYGEQDDDMSIIILEICKPKEGAQA